MSSAIQDLRHDFYYFLSEKSPVRSLFTIQIRPAQERKEVPWIPILRTRRSTIFWGSEGERQVCFFGKAWTRYAFWRKEAILYCDEGPIAYEALYLVLLSYLGEELGLRGLQRMHGLGIRWDNHGLVLLARSGGGKSTLLLELLKENKLQILSDDTPLIGAGAKMVAFPQRVAIQEAPEVPDSFVRKFPRVYHGEKYVIGAQYFEDKIIPRADVDWLVLISRRREARASIRGVGRWRAVWPAVKWLVLGYETPQIWELFIRFGGRDLLAKGRIFMHRVVLAFELVLYVSVAELTTSYSPKDSLSALRRFFVGQEETPT